MLKQLARGAQALGGIVLVATLALTALPAVAETVMPTPVDLAIVNGQVADGLGGEPRRADVVIGDGRILFVGRLPDGAVPDDRLLDAAGRIVAPGFIDPHSHGDPFATPAFENFLAMG